MNIKIFKITLFFYIIFFTSCIVNEFNGIDNRLKVLNNSKKKCGASWFSNKNYNQCINIILEKESHYYINQNDTFWFFNEKGYLDTIYMVGVKPSWEEFIKKVGKITIVVFDYELLKLKWQNKKINEKKLYRIYTFTLRELIKMNWLIIHDSI